MNSEDQVVRDQIEWERWEACPVMSHIDQSCDKCLHRGPLLSRFGKTDQGARVLRTHWAARCPSCGEEVVYLLGPWGEVEELYQPPDFNLAGHARLRQPSLFDLEVPGQ